MIMLSTAQIQDHTSAQACGVEDPVLARREDEARHARQKSHPAPVRCAQCQQFVMIWQGVTPAADDWIHETAAQCVASLQDRAQGIAETKL